MFILAIVYLHQVAMELMFSLGEAGEHCTLIPFKTQPIAPEFCTYAFLFCFPVLLLQIPSAFNLFFILQAGKYRPSIYWLLRKLLTKPSSVSLFYHITWRGVVADDENFDKHAVWEAFIKDRASKHKNGYAKLKLWWFPRWNILKELYRLFYVFTVIYA